MSLNNFIPAIWSANLITALEKAHVYSALANKNYEGEIRNFGDTVKINQLGSIAIGTYTKNGTISAPQELTDAQTQLIIDQAKYFNFKIDDIDKAQINPKVMQEAMRKSAYALSDVVDTYFAGLHAQAGLTYGSTGTPIDINSANVVASILAVGQKMTEADVPTQNRFMVIPAWLHTKLVLAKIISDTNNSAVFTNGQVGEALGFKYYLSNNVSVSSNKYKILAGIEKESLSFAEQIVSVEAYRPENSFSDAVKGLHLYGGKIIRPDMTLCLTATNKAEA